MSATTRPPVPVPIPLSEIEAARERISDLAIRTPLVRFHFEGAPGEIYLKLENLQPIGSFKLRGAGNAIRSVRTEDLRDGVFTASAGNMAQGVAWCASRLSLPSSVVVPDHAPKTKLAAIERLGMKVVKVSFDEWWKVIETHEVSGLSGLFIHPVAAPAVMAGNGTIGLEILDDLPDVDAVVIPYGGGGLTSGIASVLRQKKPDTKVFACEVETAAPLAASLKAGRPVEVEYTASFVDGIGGKGVLPEMWPIVSALVDGSIVVGLSDIAKALRLVLERNRVLAEGAGASSVAAALSGKAGSGKIVCVVSGGNIDLEKLAGVVGMG